MTSFRAISFQALIALSMLAFLEAAVRVGYTVQLSLTKKTQWFVFSSDTGWERRPYFSGFDDCGEHRAFGRQGFLLSDVARLNNDRPGKFRALFLGDSNTYGYCLEADETFVEVANRLLPDTSSINLGVPGYSSYQGYQALQKYGDQIKPNILFVSFNFNDRRLVLDPGLTDGETAFKQLLFSTRALQFAELSYLFGAARYLAQTLFPQGPQASGYAPNARLDKLVARVSATGYRENLTKMVLWAQHRGIAVVFILLGDNPDQTYLLREGIGLLSAGKYHEAISKLESARDEGEDQTFSVLARLYLAKAYEGAKLRGQAQEALHMDDVFAGPHGGSPLLLDTEYQQIMRDVGARYGVPVIDAVAELNVNADVYFDQCHFDKNGHEVVGRLIVNAIKTAKATAQDVRR